MKSRRACAVRLLAAWGSRSKRFPTSQDKLRQLGASLRAGGYRSASSILSQWKVDAERRGQGLGVGELRLLTDINRACRRGLGPPLRAGPLPFERLRELPGGVAAWVPRGPVGARNAVVIGSWWLLCEMELANVRARLVAVLRGPALAVSIDLPASKADSAAQGAVRTHACICSRGALACDCPAHAVLDQLLVLRGFFPSRFVEGLPDSELPLFPTPRGAPRGRLR